MPGHRLTQEFITPYTPEQNGIIERFFRSLKEECVWQHVSTFEDARRVIRAWLQWYNQERPHQAFSYRSPIQYRTQQVTQVALISGEQLPQLDPAVGTPGHKALCDEFRALSSRMACGRPRQATTCSKTRITRSRAAMSTSIAKPSRTPSSSTFKVRNRRPL